MKWLYIIIFVLGALHTYTCIQLVTARHEIRALKGEIEEHDGMLEGFGDDLTRIEFGFRTVFSSRCDLEKN